MPRRHWGLALAALLGLAIWLMAFDIARRTIAASGLSRYMAACLLAGYAWLGNRDGLSVDPSTPSAAAPAAGGNSNAAHDMGVAQIEGMIAKLAERLKASVAFATQHHGKELSYINLLDADAALADGDHEFDLVVQAGGQRRVVDLAGLAGGHRHQRVGRLHEEERRLAAGEAHLLGMLGIVAAHAVDAVHGEQAPAGHGDGRNGGCGDHIGHGSRSEKGLISMRTIIMPRAAATLSR